MSYIAMSNIRILVVDDQHLVRMGLVRMLGDMPRFIIAGEAENGEQALEKIGLLINTPQAIDVVLMDMRMPGMGGLEATKKLTQRYPAIKVIAVTGCSEAPFPQRFLECGALGFISKDSAIEEVALAIQSVYRGKRYIGQEVAQEMALNTSRVTNDKSPFDQLSERELQIALMVIDGIKTVELAATLHVSPKTIHTYRYRIFEKLQVKSNMELSQLASRFGLIEQDLPEADENRR